MMLGSIGIGVLASALVAFSSSILAASGGKAFHGFFPLVYVLIAALAGVVQKFWIDQLPAQRNYEGLADLFLHIHTPSLMDVPWRWVVRGMTSFLFCIAGAGIGPEGAAIEFCYAAAVQFRSRSAKWFENRRRTDTASVLAAGVSAAFGAPFAGMLFPMEMSVGGRTIQSAVAALAAFIGSRYFSSILPIRHFELGGALHGFELADWHIGLAVLAISFSAGLLALLLVRLIRFCRSGLTLLFRSRRWLRFLAGGILLAATVMIYSRGGGSSSGLLEDVLWLRMGTEEVALLIFSRFLVIAVLLSAFGSAGVLWPVFALGGMLGFWVNFAFFGGISGFAAASGLVGASAFWGALFGTPVAAAVLCFELTHNLQVILPCFIGGILARETMRLLKGRKLVDIGLEARGLRVIEGRSVSVLDSIQVRDAMIRDHDLVQERESVVDLRQRLSQWRYPFLPVVREDGTYSGLLTLDLIQEAWHSDEIVTASSPLSRLLEVKDLLYRAGAKTPTIREGQSLSEIASALDLFPCLPVLSEEGRVTGLLLVQNVRLAYDREVVRRSLVSK